MYQAFVRCQAQQHTQTQTQGLRDSGAQIYDSCIPTISCIILAWFCSGFCRSHCKTYSNGLLNAHIFIPLSSPLEFPSVFRKLSSFPDIYQRIHINPRAESGRAIVESAEHRPQVCTEGWEKVVTALCWHWTFCWAPTMDPAQEPEKTCTIRPANPGQEQGEERPGMSSLLFTMGGRRGSGWAGVSTQVRGSMEPAIPPWFPSSQGIDLSQRGFLSRGREVKASRVCQGRGGPPH